MLTQYWVRVITEDLPEGDPEEWRASFKQAFGSQKSRAVESVATAFDAKRRRMVLTFEVRCRTGSAALELVAGTLRAIGEHPELVAIRQLLLYPAARDDGSVITFDDVAEMFGPEEWKAFEEQQFEPDY